MPCWPVSYQDGKYQITDADGILYPITMGRLPVEVLAPGWYPVGLQTGLKPYYLLELRNDNGPETDAVWYLSQELDFVANAARHFSPDQAAQVTASLAPLLRDIREHALSAPQPGVAPSTQAFEGINPAFVRELVDFAVQTAVTPPDVVAVHRLEPVSAAYEANGVRLSASLLRESLDIAAPASVQENFTAASPVDFTLLTAQEGFKLAGGAIDQAYRFLDPTERLAFYILFQENGGASLYVPTMNTVFATTDGISGADILTALLSHYASGGDRRAPVAPSDTAPVSEASPPAAPPPEAAVSAAAPAPHEAETPIIRPYDNAVLETLASLETTEAPPAAHPEPVEPPEPRDEETEGAISAEPETSVARAGSFLPFDTRDLESPEAQGLPANVTDRQERQPNWWKRLFGLGNP